MSDERQSSNVPRDLEAELRDLFAPVPAPPEFRAQLKKELLQGNERLIVMHEDDQPASSRYGAMRILMAHPRALAVVSGALAVAAALLLVASLNGADFGLILPSSQPAVLTRTPTPTATATRTVLPLPTKHIPVVGTRPTEMPVLTPTPTPTVLPSAMPTTTRVPHSRLRRATVSPVAPSSVVPSATPPPASTPSPTPSVTATAAATVPAATATPTSTSAVPVVPPSRASVPTATATPTVTVRPTPTRHPLVLPPLPSLTPPATATPSRVFTPTVHPFSPGRPKARHNNRARHVRVRRAATPRPQSVATRYPPHTATPVPRPTATPTSTPTSTSTPAATPTATATMTAAPTPTATLPPPVVNPLSRGSLPVPNAENGILESPLNGTLPASEQPISFSVPMTGAQAISYTIPVTLWSSLSTITPTLPAYAVVPWPAPTPDTVAAIAGQLGARVVGGAQQGRNSSLTAVVTLGGALYRLSVYGGYGGAWFDLQALHPQPGSMDGSRAAAQAGRWLAAHGLSPSELVLSAVTDGSVVYTQTLEGAALLGHIAMLLRFDGHGDVTEVRDEYVTPHLMESVPALSPNDPASVYGAIAAGQGFYNGPSAAIITGPAVVRSVTLSYVGVHGPVGDYLEPIYALNGIAPTTQGVRPFSLYALALQYGVTPRPTVVPGS